MLETLIMVLYLIKYSGFICKKHETLDNGTRITYKVIQNARCHECADFLYRINHSCSCFKYYILASCPPCNR